MQVTNPSPTSEETPQIEPTVTPRSYDLDEERLEPIPPKRGEKLPGRVHLLVLAGYTLLSLVLTYPLVTTLGTEVIGGGDVWQHIWNLWWVKEALVEGPTNPYFTDLLYYPDGVGLYFHTL